MAVIKLKPRFSIKKSPGGRNPSAAELNAQMQEKRSEM